MSRIKQKIMKKNVQNKTKDYESGKYFLAICKYHVKILLVIFQ